MGACEAIGGGVTVGMVNGRERGYQWEGNHQSKQLGVS